MQKTALITGATRGIGKACALAMARRGFDIAVTGRTRREGEGKVTKPFADDPSVVTVPGSIETTVAEVEALGREAIGLQVDITDRASEETDRALELRTRDRQRKLVLKIEQALRRIDEGEYGYCEVTGEPISLKRLDARPIATMTLEAQERHERREKVHRDD